MVRTAVAAVLIMLTFGAVARAAQVSLVNLDPREREAMLSTCGRLGGDDRALCRDVVNDNRVVANYKRSCLQAFTLLLRGTAWSKVQSLPPTLTCREGLARAGYPVKEILGKLARAL